ncbi:MAG: methylmalonyl-CoA mutase family protein [Planctomycetota bacterium]|nr:methylmalonyl-CoA mutase family protein [Planctomycetota bacterium]MDP6941881.1 methylmalonyl-CoA mutase family protein [Planctomycetota bacterium]
MSKSTSQSGRKAKFLTASGLSVPECALPGDASPPADGPGEYPFTRGIHPGMYRDRLWTMRQYAGFSSAKATNERFRYLLERGQTGLSVAFDLPTQMGYESDHELAIAEAGKVGVAVNSLKDFEQLFDGIPLGEVSTSMTINATALPVFAMYVALCKRQDVPAERILGTVQNDILKEFVARGNYRFGVEASMRLTTDLFQFQQAVAPRFNPISVSGYHMREAGCTAIQEIAFTLGDGVAYLEAARTAGLDLGATAKRMSFFFNGHNELFEEVAKFRAARRMWARIVKERFGVEDPRAQKLRFHTQTGGSTLTSQQPLVNSARVTLQALAAVLGGTQSLHTNSYDEALSLPSEESALLALRTQQVIAHESGVADIADPLGGAPFVEKMTDDVEGAAMTLMSKVDEEFGGMVGAVAAGFVQREIHREAVRHQQGVESGDRAVVGVNQFVLPEEKPAQVFRPDPSARNEIFDGLSACREGREDQLAKESLERLAAAAQTDAPLGQEVLEAVEAYATIGEICGALETVFPLYHPPSLF